jgi:D-alanyl-D-alanine carboxypeptidase (penicillin-binding protein 5/6)
VAALLAALVLLAAVPGDAAHGAPEDRFPGAAAAYLVAVDGRVIWARALDSPRAPASLAKLMAALVAAEAGAGDAWIRVSRRAAGATGSRLGLRGGEEIRRSDALAAMLVASANDACLALAEDVAGSAPAFVERMNRRARDLGLAGTRFVDPCGHDAPGQRVTARDLQVLASAVLRDEGLRRTVARPAVRVETRRGRELAAPSSNALLGRLEGADGVKTGFTPDAGKCVVAHATRDGREVLVVLLGAPDRWWTAAALVERAFAEAPPRG